MYLRRIGIHSVRVQKYPKFTDDFKVVSFDAEWREVYMGYVRKDVFTGLKWISELVNFPLEFSYEEVNFQIQLPFPQMKIGFLIGSI